MARNPLQTLAISTQARSQMIEITRLIRKAVTGIESGYLIIYVPHTTAGITIQENADPDVQHDLLEKLDQLVPENEKFYRHAEGNSDSHLKTSLVGNSVMVLIENGQLLLGQWQGIYLCEFDGPREREVIVKRVATPEG